MTDSPHRRLLNRMKTSKLPIRRDKPLPSPPVATLASDDSECGRTLLDAGDQPLEQFVPLTPSLFSNNTLNGDSRPHSPAVSSFSRIRRISGIPTRAGAASPLARRNSSRLARTPSNSDSYSVTDEEFSGLRNVNRRSRDGRHRRAEGHYHRARVVDIRKPKNKADKTLSPTSPPSASIHTSPLTTIHSQAALPTYDLDALQAKSTPSTPPNQAQHRLPPRSDSRTPWTRSSKDAASDDDDDGISSYSGRHEFRDFSGVVNIPIVDDQATSEKCLAKHHSPVDPLLVFRNDSPMQPVRRFAGDDAARSIKDADEDDEEPATPTYGPPLDQEIADRIEPAPLPAQVPRPQILLLPGFDDRCYAGVTGLAGVQTAGKLRAARDAREAMQKQSAQSGQSEPNFARTTASSAAKSSAPPDIPRAVCVCQSRMLRARANCSI